MKTFTCPSMHGLDGADRVEAVLWRRREIEFLAERVHELRAHLFPDADGAVALHVAVPAHGADARAAAADLAAQQGEIDDASARWRRRFCAA